MAMAKNVFATTLTLIFTVVHGNQCAAISFGTGIEAGGTSACSDTQQLDASTNCNVKCGTDYTVTTDVTISCASGISEGDASTGMPTCVERQLCSADSSSGVCAGSAVKDDTARCVTDTCDAADFGDNSKNCCVSSGNKCAVISFGTGIEAGSASPCSDAQQMSAGAMCRVKCGAAYTVTSDVQVRCSANAVTGAAVTGMPTCVASSTSGGNQCAAISFGSGIEAGSTEGCSDAQQLTAGATCKVKCGAAFTVTTDVDITCATDAAVDAAVSGMPACVECWNAGVCECSGAGSCTTTTSTTSCVPDETKFCYFRFKDEAGTEPVFIGTLAFACFKEEKGGEVWYRKFACSETGKDVIETVYTDEKCVTKKTTRTKKGAHLLKTTLTGVGDFYVKQTSTCDGGVAKKPPVFGRRDKNGKLLSGDYNSTIEVDEVAPAPSKHSSATTVNDVTTVGVGVVAVSVAVLSLLEGT